MYKRVIAVLCLLLLAAASGCVKDSDGSDASTASSLSISSVVEWPADSSSAESAAEGAADMSSVVFNDERSPDYVYEIKPDEPCVLTPTGDMPPYVEKEPVSVKDLYALPEEKGPLTITLSFAGDCMLASYKNMYSKSGFREYSETKPMDYFLSGVSEIFKADDYTVVNLECVLTDKDLSPRSKPEDPAYWYRGKTENVEILTAGGVDAVSLANNHTDDYGSQGAKDTRATLEAAGLPYGDDSSVLYYTKGDFTVAVICCGLWRESQADGIVKRLNEIEGQSDFQVVYFHGGKMNVHEAEGWKQKACHKIVDAGADLVVGAHPHVLQPVETYKGVTIAYSLGNFCYGGRKDPENRTVILQTTLTVGEDMSVTDKTDNFIPCYVYGGNVNDFRPYPIEDENEKQAVLDFVCGNRKVPFAD